MKKGVLLSTILISTIWAGNIEKFYITQNDSKINFYIKGNDINNKSLTLYIDSDNNSNTGYKKNNIKGMEYKIENGNLYQFSNQKWKLISQSIYEEELSDGTKIVVDKNDIKFYPYIKAFLLLKNSDKEEYKTTTKNIIDPQKDYYVKKFYNYWKKTYLVKNNDGTYRVAFDKKNKSKTVSEGQGYGMLITVMMADYDPNAKKYFDGLFNFVKKHPSKFSPHLMAWIYPEGKNGEDSAFDGDADIAYALILADKIWGSNGNINYKKEALNVLNDIWKHTIGPKSKLPMLGDWVDPNGKKYNQYTFRSSDCMLDHFKAFANFTGETKWLDVVDACKNALKQVQNTKTGLVPDFVVKKDGKFVSAPAHFLESKHDGDYDYNACRDPLRIGIDALMYNDIYSTKFVNIISNWLSNEIASPEDIKSGYKLNGKYYADYFSTAFASPFAVGMLKNNKETSDDIFDYVKDIHDNYYEDSLNMISMAVLAGRYYYIPSIQKTKTDNNSKNNNNSKTVPPYSIDKFKKVLNHSGLQYPDSSYVVQPGEFEDFKTDYFYAENRNLIINIQQKKDHYIKRCELREKYPNKKNYGEWKTSTSTEKKLYARVKFYKPTYLKEFTFLQIHADGNKNSINKPLLRIVWLDEKKYDNKNYKDYIWALVKKDKDGKKTEYIPLIKRPNTFFKVYIYVKKNLLTIKANDKTIKRNVSFWKNYYNYFKAGAYISGSKNNKIDKNKRNVLIKFSVIRF